MVDTKVVAETYLVLVPDFWEWYGETRVRGIRVDRVRAQKPALKKGEIAIRLKLNFDKKQLIDAIPVVSVDVNDFSVAKNAPDVELVGEAVN